MTKKENKKKETQVKFAPKGKEVKEFERIQKNTVSSTPSELVRNMVFGLDAVLQPTEMMRLTSTLAGTSFDTQIDHLKGRKEVDFLLLKLLGKSIRKDIFLDGLSNFGISIDDLENIKEGTSNLIDADELEEMIKDKMEKKLVEEKVKGRNGRNTKEDIYGYDESISKAYSLSEVHFMNKLIESSLGKEMCYRFSSESVDYIVPCLLYKLAAPANDNGTVRKRKVCDEEYKMFFWNPMTKKIQKQEISFKTLLYKIVDPLGIPYTEYGLRLSYIHNIKKKNKTVICTMGKYEGVMLNNYYELGTRFKQLSHFNILKYDTTNLDYSTLGDTYDTRGLINLLKENYKMTTTKIEGTEPYLAALALNKYIINTNLNTLMLDKKRINEKIVEHYKINQKTLRSLIFGR